MSHYDEVITIGKFLGMAMICLAAYKVVENFHNILRKVK